MMMDPRLSASNTAIRELMRLREPSCPVTNRHGAVAFLVSNAAPVGSDDDAELWLAEPGAMAEAVALDTAPTTSSLAWSPDGSRLAFEASPTRGTRSIRLYQGTVTTRQLASPPGPVEDLQWSSDGRRILALVRDPDSETAPAEGWRRRGDRDAVVSTPSTGWRRLIEVNVATGDVREVGLPQTVWEFAWGGGSTAVALVSNDRTESGWYGAKLVAIDLERGGTKVLFEDRLQIAGLALSPSGRRCAFVAGTASDRGLVPGQVRIVDLETSDVSHNAEIEDVTWLGWESESALLYARWDGLGTAIGRLHLTAGHHELWADAATIGGGAPRCSLSEGHLVTILEASGVPPEVVSRTVGVEASAGGRWEARSDVNRSIEPWDPEIEELVWGGPDDLEIHGLLLRPSVRVADSALIALLHGGPTDAWTHAFAHSHGQALALAAAGFHVLMPNPRGSAGRGLTFAQANRGDLGGADFADVVDGVRWCRSEVLRAPGLPLGVTGVSYGGFLSAWAATQDVGFTAAAPISCISDWRSFLYTSSIGDFATTFLGDPEADRDLYERRSPMVHAHARAAPSLILQGESDMCTPVGQATEFANALRRVGVPTESVVYRGEGHFPEQRRNQVDVLKRSRRWFARHLLRDPSADLLADG